MKVSFIIPHKGRLDMLKDTVMSVFNLNYDQSLIEVIVVSQNASLSPQEVLAGKHDNLHVFLRPESDTISALRNEGARQAEGDFYAFLDADVHLSSNWLTVMFEQLQQHDGRLLVSAHQECLENAPELEKLRTVLSNGVLDDSVSFLPGRNLFLHRDTFEQVSGFPEHLVTCEDYYFTDKVNELGELYYTSDAGYLHLGEDKEWGQLFQKEIWRGQSNLKSLNGRTVPLREYPSLLVPLWVFFFAIVFCSAYIFMNVSTLVLASVAILLPILLYSQRLFRLGKRSLSYGLIIKFYFVYFTARAIGTVVGLVKSIHVRNAS